MRSNPLDKFLSTSKYRPIDGYCVQLKAFIEDFHEALKEDQRTEWTRSRIILELRSKSFPVGPGPKGIVSIGNMADKDVPLHLYEERNGKVRLKKSTK